MSHTKASMEQSMTARNTAYNTLHHLMMNNGYYGLHDFGDSNGFGAQP